MVQPESFVLCLKLFEFLQVALYLLHGLLVFFPSYPSAEQAAGKAEGNEKDTHGRGGILEKECQADAQECQGQTDDSLIDIAALVVGQGAKLCLNAAHHIEA